jgi:hypothetical protein
MGQLFLQDWLLSHKSVEDFTTFEMADIDAAFELIEYVKYGQVVRFFGQRTLTYSRFV